jgi:hypothetical protein
MYAYGKHLGLAFQVVDDILDFTQSSEQLGKPQGQDLASGNLTAPVIYALQVGTSSAAAPACSLCCLLVVAWLVRRGLAGWRWLACMWRSSTPHMVQEACWRACSCWLCPATLPWLTTHTHIISPHFLARRTRWLATACCS